MNSLAKELNQVIQAENGKVYEMLSALGKELFFPKGILSQSAEAKQSAKRINATIGIATENNHTMFFPSIMAALDSLKPEETLNYAPSYGVPELREAWKEELYKKNPSLKGKSISLPVVTAGITNGISVFADLFLDPGDVVILPDLMWGNYNMILSVRKAARISQYRVFTDEYNLDLDSFEKKVMEEAGKNSKITVLINLPHNPSGYTVSQKEAEEIVRILKRAADTGTNVIAAFDDSYFGLFYDETSVKESIFAKVHSISENMLAVKMDGATKEFFAWGLRVGFITFGAATVSENPGAFYEALERKTAGCIRGMISNASHLSQTLVVKSLKDTSLDKEKNDKFNLLKERAIKVKEVLKDPKYKDYFEAYPFNSGYFMCLKVKGVNAETLRVHLLKEYGVGLISLGDDKLRVTFSCVELNDIPVLFDMVMKGMEDLKKV